MKKTFSLSTLTEGIKELNILNENARLVQKWAKTGLLRNLPPRRRAVMARLFENQMAQIIREANALSTGGGQLTSSGQIRGFVNTAFPLVRKVFGGLMANELVSIQPMSLPSGLLYYIDYTYGKDVGGEFGPDGTGGSDATYAAGSSIYGDPAGKAVQQGAFATGGQYDLVGHGYTRVHSGSASAVNTTGDAGAFNGANEAWASGSAITSHLLATGANGRALGFDPDVISALAEGDLDAFIVHVPVANITSAIPAADLEGSAVTQVAVTNLATMGSTVAWGSSFQDGTGILNLRRLNKRGNFDGTTFTEDPYAGDHIQMVFRIPDGASMAGVSAASLSLSAMLADKFDVSSTDGTTLTIPAFESDFGSPPSANIMDIGMKLEAVPVVSVTRKLRANWTPEFAQDVNAYMAIDAEVELTQILSKQIALDIDNEILGDLLRGATGAKRYWSRAPGVFVDKLTGRPISLASSLATGPAFTGTVSEWYGTLVETIIDAGNEIYRKTLQGSANFVVTSPDVCTILESTVMYRPAIKFDGSGQAGDQFVIGAEAVGTLSNRFTVYKNPYFPRNKILVGFKGGTALEAGYVYAPYVPLIVTQTVYGPDDFTPRKGVMTRYGRKMIRADFYGTVTVLDLNVI